MRWDTYRYLNLITLRERGRLCSFSLGNVVETEDTYALAVRNQFKNNVLRLRISPLDGCSTRQSDLFGKVPQQAAESGVRTGIELECNR